MQFGVFFVHQKLCFRSRIHKHKNFSLSNDATTKQKWFFRSFSCPSISLWNVAVWIFSISLHIPQSLRKKAKSVLTSGGKRRELEVMECDWCMNMKFICSIRHFLRFIETFEGKCWRFLGFVVSGLALWLR